MSMSCSYAVWWMGHLRRSWIKIERDHRIILSGTIWEKKIGVFCFLGFRTFRPNINIWHGRHWFLFLCFCWPDWFHPSCLCSCYRVKFFFFFFCACGRRESAQEPWLRSAEASVMAAPGLLQTYNPHVQDSIVVQEEVTKAALNVVFNMQGPSELQCSAQPCDCT